MDRKTSGALGVILTHPRAALLRYKLLLQQIDRDNEVFYRQEYHWLAQRLRKGTTVLDIGANIGNTAIYFAQFNEVRRVVAYEPAPYTYRLMLSKLSGCAVAGKIETRMEGIAGREGSMRIPDSYMDTRDCGLEDLQAEQGKAVRVVTLGQALKGLRNVAIKCDAEGAEETLFDGADLSEVYVVIVEWHGTKAKSGAAAALAKAGFRTRVQWMCDGPKEGGTGFLYAEKRG